MQRRDNEEEHVAHVILEDNEEKEHKVTISIRWCNTQIPSINNHYIKVITITTNILWAEKQTLV